MKNRENSTRKDLVQIIKDNPGCVAIIDNSFWTLRKKEPEDFNAWDELTQEQWLDTAELVNSEEKFQYLQGELYQFGNCYGGDIILALAEIVGIEVNSV